MSSSGILSISSFNLLFFTQVLTVVTTTIKYSEYITDKGKTISIPCEVDGLIMWVKEGKNDSNVIQTGQQILVLKNVSEIDAGLYLCLFSNDTDDNTENSDGVQINSENYTTALIRTTKNAYANLEDDFKEYLKANLTIRTPPGPVSELKFNPSTILGYLVWKFNKTNSGGYPIRSFTAEYRNVSSLPNVTYNWTRLDPINISPNIRQMEVYHLLPNTTYQFRIWANNLLGPGKIVTTNVTTRPETREEDLIRLIQADIDNFDPRIWMAAVGIVLGTLLILGISLCILLARECQQPRSFDEDEDGWDSIELVPNIILNPGFCESDEHDNDTPGYTRTIIFGEDDESDGYESEEEPIKAFKRKVSIFFTGHTIKRI